jgi:hypothetical protein
MHIEGDQVREPSSTFLIGSKSKGARNMALLPFFQSVFNSGKKFPALSRISNFPGIYPFSGKSWKLFMNPNGFFGKIWQGAMQQIGVCLILDIPLSFFFSSLKFLISLLLMRRLHQ